MQHLLNLENPVIKPIPNINALIKLVIWLLISTQLQANNQTSKHTQGAVSPGNEVVFIDDFEGLLLGPDPHILNEGSKIGFIASSYMGAYGGVNNYLELIVNVSPNPVPLNTVPARLDKGGWFWGLGLWDMTPGLDRIEDEGDFNTCVFLDGPIQTMREFANRLFAACDKVVLFADAGGHNPVSLGAGYFDATANTLANARQMQLEYPDLLIVPTAYVFYELTTNPVVAVPRLDYLYGDDNIHQNGLGTLVNAYSLYAAFSSRSPLGLAFDFGQPATVNHQFMDGDFILLGHNLPSHTPNDRLLFDENTQHLIQQRILDLLIDWRAGNTIFNQQRLGFKTVLLE